MVQKVTLGASKTLAGILAAQSSAVLGQVTKSSGTIVTHNEDGSKTILGEQAGTAGVAQWVGDTTPPGVPTGVTATSRNGVVIVAWDGTITDGIPADFAYVTLYVDGTSIGTLTGAGSIPVDGLTIGTTVQVTATASDDAHAEDGSSASNASSACSPVFVRVASAVDPAAIAAAQAKADSAAADAQSAIDAGVAAQAKATAATTASATAQSAADAAAQAAASAVSTANTATTTATSAQTAATNAATAASTAQTTASNAASTAAAKAKVTVATTAPSSPSTNDVWIDNSQGDSNAILKTWSGSGWVTHTDAVATNAATAAAAAQTTATNAATAAASAQATANAAAVSATAASASANGVVTWSTAVASGTPTATSAVWMQYTSSGTIIGQWRWNPATSQWVSQTIDNAVIANLDAGKIVTGLLAAERIAAASITVEKLSISAATSTNAIANGMFEDGLSGWYMGEGTGTVSVSQTYSSSGSNSLKITKTGSGTNVRALQKAQMLIPVNGATWYVACRARGDVAQSNGFYFRIFWYAQNTNAMSYIAFTDIAANVALSTSWTLFEWQGTPPSGAKYFGVSFYQTVDGATLYVDDVVARPASTTVMIADGSIITPKLAAGAVTTPVLAANAVTADKADIGSLAAAIITSAYFRTSSTVGQASNGQGLIIDSAGLRTYNSSGTNTVNLSASDGSLTAIGAFKTAASGNRVEVVSETNGTNKTGALYVYNGAAGGETPSWLKTTTSESNVTDTTKSGYRYTTAQLNGGITTDTQSPSVNSAGLTLVRGWYRNASNDVRLTSQAVIGADMTYVNGTVTWIAGFPHITATTLSALNSSPWVARLQSSEFAWAGIIYGHVTADTTAANNGDYIRSGSAWVRPALNLFTPATNPWKGVAFDPNVHRKVIYAGVKSGTTDGNSYLTVDLTSVGFLGLASAQVANASSTLNRASIVDSSTSLTSLSVIHRNADFSGAANTGVEYAYTVYGWTAL